MNLARCPFCEIGSSFEAELHQVKNYEKPLALIVCSSCHKPIGVMEAYNVSAGIITIKEKLDAIINRLP